MGIQGQFCYRWSVLMAIFFGSAALAAEPTIDQREAAAKAAAVGKSCASLNFYWEIGDANGNVRSGNGPAGTAATKVKPTKSDYIASSGKWLYAAYALEKSGGVLSEDASVDVRYLNFTSGHQNLGPCAGKTVGACGDVTKNNKPTPADVGKFYYGSGHMEAHASKDALGLIGLKDLKAAALGPAIGAALSLNQGSNRLDYAGPVLAGDAKLDALNYTWFLRQVLNGTHKMKDFLGVNAVCASADRGTGNKLVKYCPRDADGRSVALSSPPELNDYSALTPNQDYLNSPNPDPTGTPWPANGEPWKYSIGHWVERDGTFSSPGAFGFYPWIDKDKKWYGVVARYETGNVLAYQKSVVCGRAIRNAWLFAKAS